MYQNIANRKTNSIKARDNSYIQENKIDMESHDLYHNRNESLVNYDS